MRYQLQSMVDACPTDTLAGKRDRLLLIVLRALEGRPGELVALRAQDVVINPPPSRSIGLNVGTYGLDIPAGEYTDHDPCELADIWLTKACLDPWLLFRPITKDDLVQLCSLTPAAVNQIVKRAARRAELDNPQSFTARSVRGPVRRKVGQQG